jgi:hypothetical protein
VVGEVGEKGEVALGGGCVGGRFGRSKLTPLPFVFCVFVNITGNIVNRNIRGLF